MKIKSLFCMLLLLAPSALAAQTIKLKAGQTVAAGQCVSIATSGMPARPVVPCDNVSFPPAPAIGVALTSATVGQDVTIAINGVVTVPNPGRVAIQLGQFIGDVDGTGNLADMGTELFNSSGPESYVGIGIANSADLTTLTILVQPGYVAAP